MTTSSPARSGGSFVSTAAHDVGGAVADKGPVSEEQLVDDRAEAEDVGAMVGRLPPHLFRRHVADGAEHCSVARHGGRGIIPVLDGLTQASQTEVENLHDPVIGQEDVLRFQVAMHDASRVRRGQPARHVDGHVEDLRNRPWSAGHRQVTKRVAFQ